MSELTIKIEAPELSAAIQQLAEALKPRKTAEQGGQNPKPIAPAAAPAMPVPAPPTQVSAPAVPVSAPAAATPAVRPATPIPAAMTAPVAQTVAPAAPVSPPAPMPAAPSAPVAPTSAPQYTFDMLFSATAQLMVQGKGAQLQQLLTKYGVQRLPDLPREQYGAFATDLRALGVRI